MDRIRKSFSDLRTWCEIEHFRGWDPYDGLNSKLFKLTPFYRFKWTRLIWMQAFKHLPVNLRSITLVPKEENPAGLGVFLAGYCVLFKSGKDKGELAKSRIIKLADQLLDLQTPGWSGSCWGYNFPWQSRAFFLPKYYPTIVATSHIANALLDAYEITSDERYKLAARSACDFILKDLNRSENENGDFIFSYSPSDTTRVYNASLLGSRLLARVAALTSEKELLIPAKKSVDYCMKDQQADGSWLYGKLEIQDWIDSFHTGYNLESLYYYAEFSGDHSHNDGVAKGLKFYLENFFEPDGSAKYYHNRKYPIDLNPPAQLILTLLAAGKLEEQNDLAKNVLLHAIEKMQDKKGYFYFQDKGKFKIRMPYMRWVQAWMFYAMAVYLSNTDSEN